jgi:hypothetical protein
MKFTTKFPTKKPIAGREIKAKNNLASFFHPDFAK